MPSAPLELLVVEDDLLEARLVKAQLERRPNVRVHVERSAEGALAFLDNRAVDAVVTDLVLPGAGGLELLAKIRETDRSLPVVILTAHATVERAVEGIRAGATDFLPKPANVDALFALIERAVVERPLREEIALRLSRRRDGSGRHVMGEHAKLDSVRRFAERVATVPGARVLITGESGTGKSLLARAIHDLSRATGRFVQVNCAAIPSQLLESELFGHERGAFTDAKQRKRGLVEMAHHGTILLDEIGAMPQDLQAKLLTFLEEQEIWRVGGNAPIRVDARVIAATNLDLHELVKAGGFRLDLLYRLDVTSIEMPALRTMREVIPELGAHFVEAACAGFHRPVPSLTDESFAALLDHAWPGNARELRNAVERALIFHDGGPLVVPRPAVQGEVAGGAALPMPLGLTMGEVERRYIEAALAADPDADLAEVARLLGISRKTLWEKRKKWSL